MRFNDIQPSPQSVAQWAQADGLSTEPSARLSEYWLWGYAIWENMGGLVAPGGRWMFRGRDRVRVTS